MGIASAIAKINMSYPKAGSKTQANKSETKLKYIACNECHSTNTTLIKCTDSYYCKECMHKLDKKKYVKEK